MDFGHFMIIWSSNSAEVYFPDGMVINTVVNSMGRVGSVSVGYDTSMSHLKVWALGRVNILCMYCISERHISHFPFIRIGLRSLVVHEEALLSGYLSVHESLGKVK